MEIKEREITRESTVLGPERNDHREGAKSGKQAVALRSKGSTAQMWVCGTLGSHGITTRGYNEKGVEMGKM